MKESHQTLRMQAGAFEYIFQRSVRKKGELYVAIDGHGGYLSDEQCLKLFTFLLNNGVAGLPRKQTEVDDLD